MKGLLLSLLVVAFASATQAKLKYSKGTFHPSKYNNSFDLGGVYNQVQLWNLDANGYPQGPTMVYYGAMLDQNENFVSCLALAFFKGNDSTEIQYVHKMWGINKGDCQYGRTSGFAGNTGKCIMDPHGKTRYMGPDILEGIRPFLNQPGSFARVVDLDYQRSGRAPAPRAGLINQCQHPAVHKGLMAQKGPYHKTGRLGAGLHYAVIHQVNGTLRFTMRSRRMSKNPRTGKYDIPNNRIYTVNLENPVNTSTATSADYPNGVN